MIGPSEVTRTPNLDIPNVAPYQLSYTRITESIIAEFFPPRKIETSVKKLTQKKRKKYKNFPWFSLTILGNRAIMVVNIQHGEFCAKIREHPPRMCADRRSDPARVHQAAKADRSVALQRF